MLIRDWLKRLKGWVGPDLNRSKIRTNHPQAIHRERVTSIETLEERVLLTAWVSAGPTSIINGQLEGIAGLPLIGALNTVAPDPSNVDVVYVGAVNGGIWKTTNATSANPIWTPETDFQQSLSISSIEFDSTDLTHNTLIAGIGRFSSAALQGGPRTGLLSTTNGGATWTPIDGNGVLDGKNVYGVAARGSTLMASMNDADSHLTSDTGLFRSTNGGTSFTQLTVANSGLPQGIVFDLTSDPANSAVFYCGVIQAENGVNGIYKTSNTGANWTLVSGSSINSLLVNSTTSTIEMSVGTSNNLYVAVVNSGQLSGLFRSGDGGGTFTQLDTPTTNENGHLYGLEPDDDEDPGSSGGMHFSIIADPSNANLVYVGGDRQPSPGPDGVEGTADDTFPNSIGATQYDGRLFRIDASKAAGSQAVTLTHSNILSPGGGGTASNSAPHADSRDMAIDAQGRILEVDDGGIYLRTNPQNNTGDWFGVMGNLAVTEMHDVAYDSLSNTIISGNQDAGTTYQIVGGGPAYNALSNADGGEVAVDNTTLAGSNQSIRYSSYQSLAVFRRTVWDASGGLVSTTFPALTVTSGAPIVQDFRTPIALNVTDPKRMLFVGFNSVYESFDSGATISEINDGGINYGDDPQGSALAYGHPNNPDAIWFGSFNQVLVRTTLGGLLAPTATAFPGTASDIRQLALDTTTATANSAFVIDNAQIYRTTDTGSSWSDITGNLASVGAVDFRSVVFIPLSGLNALVVGTQTGVYYSIGPNYNTWKELGTGLPNTLSYDLEYNATDDVLVDGTTGRGAWILPNASQSIYNIDYGDAPDTTSGTGPGNYQTLKANNGPSHDTFLTQTTLFMGARVDGESNATPNVKANGDDAATSPDDEDGLIEPGQDLELTVGSAPVVRVRATNLTGSAATLYGWIDYNQDGVFTNGTERTSITVPAGTTNGTFILTFPVIPANTTAGSTYARFRLSSDAAAGASTGPAIGGEVEDYPASIALLTGGASNSLQNTKIANATNGGPTLTTNGLFGNAVASLGDLDGDGVPDLAVGQVGDNTAGTGRGAVQILFMNTNGTVKSSVKIGSGTNGGPTLANLDQFGSSVTSLGDLDGDGVTDLAVGAMGDDTGGTDRGAVYVLLLNSNGTVKSSVKLASGLNGGPTLLDGGLFGSSAASIGDLDGDGVTDLAVGATNDSTGGTNRGAVQVLFMSANGTVKSHVKLSSGSNGAPVLADQSQFGGSVTSLGDQNGDGSTDVAVGAVGAGTGGSVYVLQLNANGTVKASTALSSGTNGVPTLGSGDKFGTSITSLGDFDGDGVTDLAVGAPGDDFNGTDRGAVYVLLLNVTGTAKKSLRMASATNGVATLTDSDQFGSSVTLIGDLNRDGYPDLAVGAPGDDTGGNSRGAAYILFLQQPDTTPPVLNSFTRQTPSSSLTNADTLVFRATFNEAVQNVDVADFAVTGTTATITSVTAVSGS
ncbi:MAG: sodium/calcium exchanger 1, partial [Planctomycetaceae bacterium]|nr:sodium/calcium exchanger 1 [Planctomycetaceae bacterium]